MKYGYYSAMAEARHGSCVWETPNSDVVKITSTGDTYEPKGSGYLWEDPRVLYPVELE